MDLQNISVSFAGHLVFLLVYATMIKTFIFEFDILDRGEILGCFYNRDRRGGGPGSELISKHKRILQSIPDGPCPGVFGFGE